MRSYTDVVEEAERRFHFDATHHAQVGEAEFIVAQDVELRLGRPLTDEERAAARLAAGVALVLLGGPLE